MSFGQNLFGNIQAVDQQQMERARQIASEYLAELSSQREERESQALNQYRQDSLAQTKQLRDDDREEKRLKRLDDDKAKAEDDRRLQQANDFKFMGEMVKNGFPVEDVPRIFRTYKRQSEHPFDFQPEREPDAPMTLSGRPAGGPLGMPNMGMPPVMGGGQPVVSPTAFGHGMPEQGGIDPYQLPGQGQGGGAGLFGLGRAPLVQSRMDRMQMQNAGTQSQIDDRIVRQAHWKHGEGIATQRLGLAKDELAVKQAAEKRARDNFALRSPILKAQAKKLETELKFLPDTLQLKQDLLDAQADHYKFMEDRAKIKDTEQIRQFNTKNSLGQMARLNILQGHDRKAQEEVIKTNGQIGKANAKLAEINAKGSSALADIDAQIAIPANRPFVQSLMQKKAAVQAEQQAKSSGIQAELAALNGEIAIHRRAQAAAQSMWQTMQKNLQSTDVLTGGGVVNKKPSAGKPSAGPPRITDAASYNALPKGALYIDGRTGETKKKGR